MPDVIVTTEPVPIPVVEPATKVPADRTIYPVYALLLPDSVKVELELVSLLMVTAPLAEIAPESVWLAEEEYSNVAPLAIDIGPA